MVWELLICKSEQVSEKSGGVGVGRPIAHSRKLEGERVVQFLLSPV